MKKIIQICMLLFLMLAISVPVMTNIVFADPSDDDPGAYLIVHVESPGGYPLSGVPVEVTKIDGVAVKVEDGSWLPPGWGTSASTTTDSNGDAKFRMYRIDFPLVWTMTVRITLNVGEQIVERSYNLDWLWKAPTHTETIIAGPEIIQAIPEAPMGTLGLGLVMLLGLALFLIKPKIRAITH